MRCSTVGEITSRVGCNLPSHETGVIDGVGILMFRVWWVGASRRSAGRSLVGSCAGQVLLIWEIIVFLEKESLVLSG